MTAATKEQKVELRQRTVALSEEIAKTITVENGAIDVPESTYFDLALSNAELPKEYITAVHAWDGLYYPAAVRAIGEHALTLMNSDGIDEIQGAAQCNGHVLTVLTQRSKTYPGVGGADPTVKYGVTTVKVDHHFKGGQMKHSREDINSMAEQLWADEK